MPIAVICSMLCLPSAAHFFPQKVGEKAFGRHPKMPPFFRRWLNFASERVTALCPLQFGVSIHLAELRLTAHERRDKQSCQIMPLNHIAAHGAMISCGFRQRVRQQSTAQMRPAWSAASAAKLSGPSFRGPTGAVLQAVSRWEQQFLRPFSILPHRTRTPQKRGVRPEGGWRPFGDFGAEAKVTCAGARNSPAGGKTEQRIDGSHPPKVLPLPLDNAPKIR